jgi:hypothetical protein
MVDEMAMKNVVKPANREANYFMKYGKFKNFDSLPNNRSRWFTLQLIKRQCKKHNITEHDVLLGEKSVELGGDFII